MALRESTMSLNTVELYYVFLGVPTATVSKKRITQLLGTKMLTSK